MKIYIKEKNSFKQIFDSSKDAKRALYYTTSSHLQQTGSLELFINKKIRKTIQFKALPPAKRDRPSIKLELNRLSDLKVELVKSYFHHSERAIIELTPEEAAGFNKLLWGGVAFTLLLIIAVPSFLYLTGLLPPSGDNKGNSTELVKPVNLDNEKLETFDSTEMTDSKESSQTESEKKRENKEDIRVKEDESRLSKEELEAQEREKEKKREQEKRERALQNLKSYAERTVFYFEKDRASLLVGEEKKLNRLISLLQESPSVSLIVEGHSANIGLAANEERISKARAETVRNYLLKNSGLRLKIAITYYGSRKPIDHTSDIEEERKVNRRAKVIIVDQ